MLSLEDSMGRSRPLRGWSGAERSELGRIVATALREWSGAWGLGRETGLSLEPVRCSSWFEASPDLPDPGDWWPLGGAAAGLTWSTIQSDGREPRSEAGERLALRTVLAEAIFGMEGEGWLAPDDRQGGGGLAEAIADRAWLDLVARLGTALCATDRVEGMGGSRSRQWTAWSGAALIAIPWGGRDLFLNVPGPCVARCLAAPKPERVARSREALIPIEDALASQRIRLQVLLRSFELDVCTLASLRVGDVLCATHGLTAPLQIGVEGAAKRIDDRTCAAFLGAVRGRRAVELTMSPPKPAAST
jgi:hypothetical protein